MVVCWTPVVVVIMLFCAEGNAHLYRQFHPHYYYQYHFFVVSFFARVLSLAYISSLCLALGEKEASNLNVVQHCALCTPRQVFVQLSDFIFYLSFSPVSSLSHSQCRRISFKMTLDCTFCW